MTVTDFYQNRNDLPKSSTQWIINRNKALASAGESIVAARKSLNQLDSILRATTSGEFPDIPEVVNTTHRLREEINQILVSLVESSFAPSESRY